MESSRSVSPAWSSYEFDGDSSDIPPEKTLRGALSKLACLRRGSQGAVYAARDRASGAIVAVKRMFQDFRRQQDRGYSEQTLREVSLLAMLASSQQQQASAAGASNSGTSATSLSALDLHRRHSAGCVENIIRFHRVLYAPGDEVCIVMERCPLDLAAVTSAAKTYPPASALHPLLSLDMLRYVMRGLLRALAYLHECANVVHRDVKPGNILLTAEGDVRLSDFGSARMLDTATAVAVQSGVADSRASGGRMTPGSLRTTLLFAAPEVLMGAPRYGPPSDVWSAGVTFAELLQRDHLFKARSELMMISAIFQLVGTPTTETWPDFAGLPLAQAFEFKPAPSVVGGIFEGGKVPKQLQVTAACKDLLGRMLVANPAQRITAAEALLHPFFAQRDPATAAAVDGDVAAEGSTDWLIQMKAKCGEMVQLICGEQNKCKITPMQLMLAAGSDDDSDE